MSTRRHFLKTSGALGASSLLFPSIIRAENLGEPKVRIAVIGCGGRGRFHVKGLEHEKIVAVCDVDENWAIRPYRWGGGMTFEHMTPDKVPTFSDFRVMFDRMGDQIDAVSIAVPDHMHYPIALWAMAAGKHVCCEKPLVRTFEEAMTLKQAAIDSGVITQMGNQGHANNGLRDIEEWIQAGLIGEVTEVFHWTNRPVWPQGVQTWPAAEKVPGDLDWNCWLGVAPVQDYSPEIAPFKWRGYRAYGAGAIGDIAGHAMDASYTPLHLGFPTRLRSESTGRSAISFPQASTTFMDFPANDTRGPIHMTWMDGGRRPDPVPHIPSEFIVGNPEQNKRGQGTGSAIVGATGAIFSDMYSRRVRIFPDDYFRELRMNEALPEKTLPRVEGGHFREWTEGIKAGRQPGGNIADYAADFTGTALLGLVASLVDGPLEFDPVSKHFTNHDTANALLKSEYPYRAEFLPS